MFRSSTSQSPLMYHCQCTISLPMTPWHVNLATSLCKSEYMILQELCILIMVMIMIIKCCAYPSPPSLASCSCTYSFPCFPPSSSCLQYHLCSCICSNRWLGNWKWKAYRYSIISNSFCSFLQAYSYPVINPDGAKYPPGLWVNRSRMYEAHLRSDLKPALLSVHYPVAGDWFMVAFIDEASNRITQAVRVVLHLVQLCIEFSTVLISSHVKKKYPGERF